MLVSNEYSFLLLCTFCRQNFPLAGLVHSVHQWIVIHTSYFLLIIQYQWSSPVHLYIFWWRSYAILSYPRSIFENLLVPTLCYMAGPMPSLSANLLISDHLVTCYCFGFVIFCIILFLYFLFFSRVLSNMSQIKDSFLSFLSVIHRWFLFLY